jgi:hypothetical protein
MRIRSWVVAPRTDTGPRPPNGGERTAPYVVPRSIEALVDRLRAATNGGWALGDARFKLQIAEALGWRVAPL